MNNNYWKDIQAKLVVGCTVTHLPINVKYISVVYYRTPISNEI